MWSRLKYSRLFGSGVALLVAGLVAFALGAAEQNVENKLTREGVQTSATVTDKTETTGRRGKKTGRVLLRYTDPGGKEHAKWQTSRALWNKDIGDKVPIVFLREDPGTTRVEGDAKWRVYFYVGAFLAGVGLLLVAAPVLGVTRSKR